jgi:hypothetical protein
VEFIYLKIITYYIQTKGIISNILYEYKDDAISNFDKINLSFSGQLFNIFSPRCLNQEGKNKISL